MQVKSFLSKVDWFAGAVAAAAKAGLIQGYPDGAFRPLDPISRQEMAAMITRALVYLKLMIGRAGDQFQPAATATRAESATLIDRLLQQLEQ